MADNDILRRLRRKHILDLSDIPPADARAGRLSGEIRSDPVTLGDWAQSGADLARDVVTAAPEAIYEASEDPTLPKITNAGVQTALTLGKPVHAAGLAALGLGKAALDDLGSWVSPLAADEADPLGGQRDRFTQLQAKLKRGKTLSRAEREEQNSYLNILAADREARIKAQSAKQTAADAAKQSEFDRTVLNAEKARDRELGRVRRFSDTEVGKVYDEMGGFAPLLAGTAAGALARLGMGKPRNLWDKIAPPLAGAEAGITAINVPLAYNAFMTEPDNPEKAAYSAYARELPEGHPRKAEMGEYAKGLPSANPVRAEAARELYDPGKLAERAAMGVVEGTLGGEMGRWGIQAPSRIVGDWWDRFKSRAGATGDDATSRAGTSQGPQAGSRTGSAPNSQSFRSYNNLPPDVRQTARDAYVVDRALAGVAPDPKAAAQAYRAAFAEHGITVPVTPARIKATNDAVERFVQQEGRTPSGPADWAKIFSDKTLAAALTAGGGASVLDGGEGEGFARGGVVKRTWRGLPLTIEVEKDGIRTGKTPEGKRWSVTMPCAYGHIPRTEGGDGEEIDIFLGDASDSPHVFAINQKDVESGDHDEQKIMLGFSDAEEAAKAYVASFSDGKGRDRLAKMMRMSTGDFIEQIDEMREARAYASGGSVGLTTVTSPSGAKFRVSEASAPRFQALLEDLESSGYGIDPATSGGYNYRTIKGTNKLSEHAHGNAIDLNWLRNARGSQGDIDPDMARRLAEKHGLTWGGDWKNPDPMHFEVSRETSGGSPLLSDDIGVAGNSYTPLPRGWGEGVGEEILKAVKSWGADSPSRAPSPVRTQGAPGAFKLALEAMPYEGSLKGLTKMPYAPEKRASGGVVSGPLRSPHMGSGGRTDTLPITVKSGAFVFPADTVSALGENNSEHGYRVLEEFFAPGRTNRKLATGQAKSQGGGYESAPDHVPIVAAEGEYVADPEDVVWVGGGDLDRGHKILEKLVLRVRKRHIADLQSLPRPHR